jgi:hypothetical protein
VVAVAEGAHPQFMHGAGGLLADLQHQERADQKAGDRAEGEANHQVIRLGATATDAHH